MNFESIKSFFKRTDYKQMSEDLWEIHLDDFRKAKEKYNRDRDRAKIDAALDEEIKRQEAKNMNEKKVTYSVGPSPDGDGAVLTFNNGGLISTLDIPAHHVNQLIDLLRVVVPEKTEDDV